MPLTPLSTSVKCPFYLRDNPQGNTITCEGYEGCKALQNNYKNHKQMMEWATSYCQRDFKQCPVYQIAELKY